MEMKRTLELILAAWRHYDDDNDLAAFEILMEIAIRLLGDLPSYIHQEVINSLFKEESEGDAIEG